MQGDDIGEQLAGVGPLHLIGGGVLFGDIAQIDDVVEPIGLPLQLFGQIHHCELNQGGAANSLLHPQLAALHAARQVDFAFAGEQRDGAHFPEVHPYRVIGVDGLFGLLDRMEILRLGVKELGRLFVKRKAQRLRGLGQELVFEMIHSLAHLPAGSKSGCCFSSGVDCC